MFGTKGPNDGKILVAYQYPMVSCMFVSLTIRIQVFRRDGTFVRKFGSQVSNDGQLLNPYGILVVGGDEVIYCH